MDTAVTNPEPVTAGESALDKLAASVNELHGKLIVRARRMIEDSVRIGALLNDVKENHLKHGEFMRWLAENTQVAQSSANNWMRAARWCTENGIDSFESFDSFDQLMKLASGESEPPPEEESEEESEEKPKAKPVILPREDKTTEAIIRALGAELYGVAAEVFETGGTVTVDGKSVDASPETISAALSERISERGRRQVAHIRENTGRKPLFVGKGYAGRDVNAFVLRSPDNSEWTTIPEGLTVRVVVYGVDE